MIDLTSYIVYDVEVCRGPDEVQGGWENPEGMGFASGVTYSYIDDQYRFWLGPMDVSTLRNYLTHKTAISFNGIKFDSRVIMGNKRIVDNYGRTAALNAVWNNYDLLLEYIKARFSYETVGEAENRLGDKAIHDGSFSLDGLAEGTLGLGKTGHGAKAPLLFREKRYADLFAYNLHDVRLTRKLFEFVQQYGFVVDRNGRVVRIPKSGGLTP